MFREKILAELRKKFAGLPEKLLGQYADKLAAAVTEESAIEGAVAELDKLPLSLKDQAALLQSESDRRVTEAQKEWEKKNPKPTDPKNDPPSDAPEWAKSLIQQNQQLQQQFQALQTEKVRGSLQEQLHAKLAEKKIPATLAKGRTIEKPEDVDAALAEIEKDYTELKQSLVNEGLGGQGTPQGGLTGGDAKGVEADIASHFAKSE